MTAETEKEVRPTKLKKALPQILAVSAKNILLLCYGTTLGYPTIVIPSVQGSNPNEVLLLDKTQISWISSINYICVPLGCLVSGLVTQPFGRKRSMQFLNFPFVAAWLLFHFSSRVEHLYLALFFTGFGGGLLEAPIITYVAEITQPHMRGFLSATSSSVLLFGVFLQFLMGIYLSWRTIALVNLVFPFIGFICLIFIPESPHWLITRGRTEDAQRSLAWLRGWTTMAEVQEEHDELCSTLQKVGPPGDHEKKTCFDGCSHYKKRTFYVPCLLLCYVFFLGHFTGMTTLQTFAVNIFGTLRAPLDNFTTTMILGIVELIASMVCVAAVHYTGKRLLTFISTIGVGLCYTIVTVYAQTIGVQVLEFQANSTSSRPVGDGSAETGLEWIPTASLIASAFLSHLGIRLLPWMLIGEVFPGEIRSFAAGICGGVGYIFGFLTNKTFLDLVTVLRLPGVFLTYGLLSFVAAISLYFILPETEGRTLGDIELHFAGKQPLGRKMLKKRKKQLEIEAESGQVNKAFDSSLRSESSRL